MRNKLNEEQKKDALNKLPGWSLVLNKESITKIMINIRANKKYMCPSEITSKRINIHNGRRTLLKHIGRDKKPLRVFWHTPIDSIHP